MNWRVRLRNRWFLSAIISLVGMVVLYWVPEFDWEGLERILMSLLAILAGIGIVTDPTTPGTLDGPADGGAEGLENREEKAE